jgi:rhodanese-related sulfurtransferase
MFRFRLLVLCMGLVVVTATSAIATHGEVGTSAGAVLTAADIKAQLTAKNKAVIIDVRSFSEYKYDHIPGAINVPSPAIKMLPARLPKDKSALIIIYARGDTLLTTNKAFNALTKLGYTNIRVFPGGMLEWHDRHYTAKKGDRP